MTIRPEQLELKAVAPIHHTTDPSSSVEAAHEVTESGRRSTHAATVLEKVTSQPGLTSTELASALPELNLYAVRRRLTDLLHLGEVYQGGAVARGGQRRQVTWWPASLTTTF